MVQINMATKEITVKVVYYGPALSGKTTNLVMLHQLMDASVRGKMLTDQLHCQCPTFAIEVCNWFIHDSELRIGQQHAS